MGGRGQAQAKTRVLLNASVVLVAARPDLSGRDPCAGALPVPRGAGLAADEFHVCTLATALVMGVHPH